MTKPVGSVSLDADNLWSYLKTHGDPSWESRPSYLDLLRPRLIDLYGRHGLTATVFVVGHDVARDDGERFVSELAHAGHEIANHSYEHEPWLHTYSRRRLQDELARTEAAIRGAGSATPVGFRGPGYSLSADLLELLAERGYEYDATTLPTWIGPLARAYYFRSSELDRSALDQRSALFGAASEVLRPVRPYRWDTAGPGRPDGLVELPVTTMPLARVPIHASYLIHAHSINPKAASAYLAATVRLLRVTRTAPSLLLHPLDLLDRSQAPGLEFFPGMAMKASVKIGIVDRAITALARHWELGSTRAHAQAVASGRAAVSATRRHDHTSAGPVGLAPRLRSLGPSRPPRDQDRDNARDRRPV